MDILFSAANGQLEILKWVAKKRLSMGVPYMASLNCGNGPERMVFLAIQEKQNMQPLMAILNCGTNLNPGWFNRFHYKSIGQDDGLLQVVFSYLPDSYRFVAPVSRTFHRNYLETYQGSSKTSWANGLQTAATAQIWYDEEGAIRNQRYPCDNAAKYGTQEALQFLRSIGCDWSGQTCMWAAFRGDFEMIMWANDHDCHWDCFPCAHAALNGHFEILKWSRSCYCDMDEWTCAGAAKNGSLEILQWARDNDCPWDEYTCLYAAQSGNCNILQWARANGCNWDPDRIIQTATNPDVLAWVRANR